MFTKVLLHMYQIFSSLRGHLHFWVHFFFTFMVNFFFDHPIWTRQFYRCSSHCSVLWCVAGNKESALRHQRLPVERTVDLHGDSRIDLWHYYFFTLHVVCFGGYLHRPNGGHYFGKYFFVAVWLRVRLCGCDCMWHWICADRIFDRLSVLCNSWFVTVSVCVCVRVQLCNWATLCVCNCACTTWRVCESFAGLQTALPLRHPIIPFFSFYTWEMSLKEQKRKRKGQRWWIEWGKDEGREGEQKRKGRGGEGWREGEEEGSRGRAGEPRRKERR